MLSISSLIIEISSSSTYGEREKEREVQGDMHNEVTQMHFSRKSRHFSETNGSKNNFSRTKNICQEFLKQEHELEERARESVISKDNHSGKVEHG